MIMAMKRRSQGVKSIEPSQIKNYATFSFSQVFLQIHWPFVYPLEQLFVSNLLIGDPYLPPPNQTNLPH